MLISGPLQDGAASAERPRACWPEILLGSVARPNPSSSSDFACRRGWKGCSRLGRNAYSGFGTEKQEGGSIMRRPNLSWCAAFVGAGGFMLAAGAALALPTGFTDVRVQSPQVTDGEFFGRSVASLGTRLVVGAPGSSIPDFSMLPGRVYVLELDGTAGLVIENPTPASGDEFGASVAVAGGNIAVGAPFDDTAAVNAGAAYVFDGTTGALLHTLLVPGSGSNDQCGRAVGALGSDVLVMCGGVYRFDGGTGALLQHYTATGCLGGRGLATIAGDVLSAGYDGTICRFDGATGAVV